MPQSVFGVGYLYATPAGANPTPMRFGALQDVSVDFSFDTKALYGSSQFALEQARGKGKIDIKSAVGRVDPNLFNSIFFGLAPSTGETLNAIDESGTIPGTPFSVTAANGATFKTDLGVYSTTTGLYMTSVASSPATGQYSGQHRDRRLHLQHRPDTGGAVKLNYTYNSASTGSRLTLAGANPADGFQRHLLDDPGQQLQESSRSLSELSARSRPASCPCR